MEKSGSFFIGVVDFFAALLPGAATVGVLVMLAPKTVEQIVPALEGDAALFAYVVAAYIVGQVLNAVASYALDVVYDALYAPGSGLLVGATRAARVHVPPAWRQALARISSWKFPFAAFIAGIVDCDTDLRVTRIATDLEKVAGVSPTRSTYGRVRAYCLLAMPTAFAEIERLESEQKFFRTSAVATLLIAAVARAQDRGSIWIWVFAAFLFTRYASRRRKTIERAYMFFGLRAVVPPASTPEAASL